MGYKQQEVASNLDYLVQKGWVRPVIQRRTFTTPKGTTRSAEQKKYKISDIGIDKLEGASVFENRPDTKKINITNIQGVTVIGDKNIVNTNYSDLNNELDKLSQQIINMESIDESTKLSLLSDIGSLQAQLQKPDPNKPVIKELWNVIEKSLVALGFVEHVSKIQALIAPLLSLA